MSKTWMKPVYITYGSNKLENGRVLIIFVRLWYLNRAICRIRYIKYKSLNKK